MDARGAGRDPAGGVRNYCYYKEIAAEPAHDSNFLLHSFQRHNCIVCALVKNSYNILL